MLNKEVGKLIQLYREKAHISQEELAETIGLSITAISNIERGVNYPTLENFIKIANTIHAPADELLEPVIECSYKTKSNRLSEMIDTLPKEKQKQIFAVIEAMIKTE